MNSRRFNLIEWHSVPRQSRGRLHDTELEEISHRHMRALAMGMARPGDRSGPSPPRWLVKGGAGGGQAHLGKCVLCASKLR